MKEVLKVFHDIRWLGVLGIILGLTVLGASFLAGVVLAPSEQCNEEILDNDIASDCPPTPKIGGIYTIIAIAFVYIMPMFCLGIIFGGYCHRCYKYGERKSDSDSTVDVSDELWRIIRRWSAIVMATPLVVLPLLVIAILLTEKWPSYYLDEWVALISWLVMPILYSLAFYKMPLAAYYIGLGTVPDRQSWNTEQKYVLAVVVAILAYILFFVII